MNIEWKYAPKWASEVRKEPVSGKLCWVGWEDNGSCMVERACRIDTELPTYIANGFESWPLVCKSGDDIELTDNLLHVYTVGGHKLYAESPEVGDLLKQLFADRANALADHFELGE